MELNNDIISFLFEQGKVSLPSLGSLILDRNPAERSVIRNKIIGPKHSIRFIDNNLDDSSNEIFIEFISNKHSISLRKAKHKIKKFSLHILNNIANYGSATIENLGTFSRNNNRLSFDFFPHFIEILDESYPDIPLLLISRKEEASYNAVSSTKIQEENFRNRSISKRKSQNWIFPFIMLTLISILFVCLFYCISNLLDEENQNLNSTVPILTDSISQNDNNLPEDSAAYIFDELSEDDTLNDYDEQNFEEYLEEDAYQSESEDLNDTIDSNVYAAGVETEVGSESNENHDSNIVDDIDKLEKVELQDLINMSSELRTKFDKSCIIIVGSFVKKSYAQKMIQRIVDSNFLPYSEKYGKYHRVGVVFDCNDKPLYQFLDELRSSVDKGSWVLKYR